jgi:hypothetical protein
LQRRLIQQILSPLSTPTNLRAFLARLLLAAVLLAGWQAALQHPVQHLDSKGGLVHLGDGHSGKRTPDGSKLCDALAALTACAAHSPALFESPATDHHAFCFSASRPRAAEAPPFLAQGPPVLL